MLINAKINYANLLTPEIEAEMPSHLVGRDVVEWKQNKANELIRMGFTGDIEHDNALRAKLAAEKDNSPSVAEETAEISDAISNLDNIAVSDNNTETTAEPDSIVEQVADPSKIPTKITQKSSKKASVKSSVNDSEDIRSVPKSVMTAIRRLIPDTASKADLISAFVYLHTDGDCEISENAMRIVKSYKAKDKALAVSQSIDERLAILEKMTRKQSEMLQAIELCTCYNTFDRRYGSKERRVSPKETEFREKGNLDMLHRLRIQASDQRKIDEIERGRQIYEQTKDKND